MINELPTSPFSIRLCSTRGEWVWSYPDGDADDDGEGAKEGSDAEETTFSLALHDEVRFRVRTLEFTQV